MKSKSRKQGKKISSKRGRLRTKKRTRVSKRPAIADPRVVYALGLMRREGLSASQAARRERMKLKTFLQGAGKYLYRSGPGKPWKARGEDELAVSMTVWTSRGPVDAIVRSSRERRLLHRYESALRMFRAGEDGAEAALSEFEGKKVGDYTLITDTNLLIQLEEADQLNVETFYTPIGARS